MFRQIAELVLLVAYIWTIVIYFQISGFIASILSMMFPFIAPAYGFLIYYFTGDPEIAEKFIVPNVLNLIAVICGILFVSTRKDEEQDEGNEG